MRFVVKRFLGISNGREEGGRRGRRKESFLRLSLALNDRVIDILGSNDFNIRCYAVCLY